MRAQLSILWLLLALSALAQPVLPPSSSPTNAPNTESVTLAWNASPSPGVAGYKIYHFAPGGPTNYVNVGNVTRVTIQGLIWPMSFFATAYDGFGLEGEPSNLLTDVQWRTDVHYAFEEAPSVGGPFTNRTAFLVRSNVVAPKVFTRLFIKSERKLKPTP